MNYLPRIAEKRIQRALATVGAVLIEGPRACGKTSTALSICGSSVRFDTNANARELALLSPSLLLDGESPRLIDEWQLVPEIWNHVRAEVDSRGTPGQFILAGSAAPQDDATRHVGAGRILRVSMRPLSLAESGFSTAGISFAQLIHEADFEPQETDRSIRDVIDEMCRGGWPALRALDAHDAIEVNSSYLEDMARADFSAVAGPRRKVETVRKIFGALARNTGSEISLSKLAAEVSMGSTPMKAETFAAYESVLRALHIVDNVTAWTPHLRSRDKVRQTEKRYFVDPSLAIAQIGANPAALLSDLNTLGFLFENLVMRDLRIYAEAADATVEHYRDSDGLEIDAIVTTRNGGWSAFEVKLGDFAVDSAAQNLLRLTERVDTARMGAPKFLGVVTSGRYSYRRPDGVCVIGIGTLGP